MSLFSRKPKRVQLDGPAAAEELRRALNTAVARAESHGVGPAAIVTALRNAIANHEYCAIVNARSSFDTVREIVHIGR
jgi:hypothetical protein